MATEFDPFENRASYARLNLILSKIVLGMPMIPLRVIVGGAKALPSDSLVEVLSIELRRHLLRRLNGGSVIAKLWQKIMGRVHPRRF